MYFWRMPPDRQRLAFQERVLDKNCFYGNSVWHWGDLGVCGRSALTVSNFSFELWQHLVFFSGIRKITFHHLTVNCNFNVLEMAFKTFHIIQGLSRTALLFIPRYLTTRFFKMILQKNKISRLMNLKIWKSQNPGSLTLNALSKTTHLLLQRRQCPL